MELRKAPNPLGPGILSIVVQDDGEPVAGLWEAEAESRRLSEDMMYAALECCNVVELFPDFERFTAKGTLAEEEV